MYLYTYIGIVLFVYYITLNLKTKNLFARFISDDDSRFEKPCAYFENPEDGTHVGTTTYAEGGVPRFGVVV